MANISDTFNRADSGSLGTADSGQVWANFGGGSFGITSNQAKEVAVNSTNSGAKISSGGVVSDGTLQATIVTPTITYTGLIFRWSDASNWLVLNITTASAIAVRKYEAGASTTLATATGLTFAATDVWTVELSGSSIIVKQNGVQRISTTSTFNQTATAFGIMARANAIYDDFSWTEAAGGGGTPDHLAFSQQPVGATNGSPLATQPKVDVRDASDALVTTDATTVTLALVVVTGSGTLSGTTSVAAVSGRATFTDLSVAGVGTFKFRASRTGLPDVDSATFSMTGRSPSAYLNLGEDGKDLGYDKSLVDAYLSVANSGDRRNVAEPRDSNGWFTYGTDNLGQPIQIARYPNTLLDTDMPAWASLQAMTQHSISGDTALRALHSSGVLDTGGHVVILDNTVVYSSRYYGSGGTNWPLRTAGDAAPGGTNVVIYISKAIWDSMVANGGVATVCPEKVRVTSADDANLVTFQGSDSLSSFLVGGATKGIRFVGIKVTVNPAAPSVSHMASLGNGDGSLQPGISSCPSNLGFDRCRFDGSATTNLRHGVELHCVNGYVIDSDWGDYIRCTSAYASECHSIISYNGPGPYRIVNNRINAGSQSIFLGGARSLCGVIADVEVRFNLMTRPLSWNPNDASYGGVQYAVKNIFEIKKAKRVLVEYNFMENIWPQGQDGAAFLLKSESYGDGATIGYTEDVVARHNQVHHCPFGANIAGVSNVDAAYPPYRVMLYNNVFEIGGTNYPAGSLQHTILGYSRYCGFIHNTFVSVGAVANALKLPDPNIANKADYAIVKDNIWGKTTYGFKGSNSPSGDLSGPCPGYTEHVNLVVINGGIGGASYDADVLSCNNDTDVGYVDMSAPDYSLYGTTQGGTPPDVATTLAVISQPTTGTIGSPLGNIVVEVRNQYGSRMTTATNAVTISGDAALSGTLTVNAVGGLATFDAAVLTVGGVYTGLTVDAAGVTGTTLAPITVTAPDTSTSGGGKTLPKRLPSKVAAQNGDTIVALWFLT